MKFILVHVGPINKYPPALSVMFSLRDLGYNVTLCATDIDNETETLCKKRNINIINININYSKQIHPFFKMLRLIILRGKLWKKIDKIYDNNTIIWVFSDLALKHLGRKLLKKNFVLHMFELSEKTVYYYKLPFLAIKTKKYANKALAVIQAEYNRAHISRAWWDLKELPYILPNKPYIDRKVCKSSVITFPYAADTIEKLKNKKIILYQGIISKERPLEPFIKAIDKLGNDYAFVIMANGKNIYKNNCGNNTFFIPFVPPPYHLEITSHAYIGILSYVPAENEFSKLNALYCAPNKLYEYAMFGIPMVGNNIPGLKYVFEMYKVGVCFDYFDEQSIIHAIKTVELNYEEMSKAAKNFYNQTDIKNVLLNIVNDISKNIKN